MRPQRRHTDHPRAPAGHRRDAALAGHQSWRSEDRADLVESRPVPGARNQGRSLVPASPSGPVTVPPMIATARRLAPRFAARAAGYDADGTFPVDDFEDLRRAGLFGLMV